MIAILDFGSQYTQLIARRIREQKVYCEIHPCNVSLDKIKKLNPEGIILSGGPSSVLDSDAPGIDMEIFNWDIPVMGICYGLQLMCHLMGGEVRKSQHSEYGHAKIKVEAESKLLDGFNLGDELTVWMSHGDSVVEIPEGFTTVGKSENLPFGVIANEEKKFYGVQFHPEVVHSVQGTEILKNFIFSICNCAPTWTMDSFIETSIEQIREKVGTDKVILGLSGGVDSSVAAVLLHRAIGDQLTCIFVDNGLLRKNEGQKVFDTYKRHYHMNMVHVKAGDEFLDKLAGVSDPETKRKIIGNTFVDIFERESKKQTDVKFLAQGTLYPDVIESESFKGPSAVIKSHHNVGGLPDYMTLKLVEPLRELFKDEVRALGKAMGMADELVYRQPFPGPGLAVRILGDITREKIATLQDADEIVVDEIKKAGLYRDIWQSFAVLLPVKSVGVQGDERTYQDAIAIRSVDSTDAMTAGWTHLPYEVLGAMSTRIINEVKKVNRVVYDITSKPPGTIEWE